MTPSNRYSRDVNSPAAASTRQSRRSVVALLASMALVVAACGTAVESTSAELPVGEFPLSESSSQPSGEDPQYGSSLDEFLGEKTGGPEASTPPEGFEEIFWEDLVPPGFSQSDISARFDERIAAVEPGSPEADAIYAELQAEYDNQPINPEMAGQEIQLAGFVAPLTYSGDLITEFLLVPYFGACVHVPPPPVNQTVMVTLEDGQGLTFDESWGAVWVTGTMTIEGAETDLATAGYSIVGAQSGVYNEY